MAPTLLIGPDGYSPFVPSGGGGGGTWLGPGGTSPAIDGSQTGPNGTFSAFPVPISSMTGGNIVTGDVTLHTAADAAALKGKRVNGRIINLLGSNAGTLQSVWVAGGSTSGTMIDCTSSGAGQLVIQDCLVKPATPSTGFGTGIKGHNYTAIRTEVAQTIDCLGAFSIAGTGLCNVVIQNCLAHDMYAWLNDPGQKNNGTSPGPSHNDGLQFQGGNNMWLLGSTMLGFVHPTIGDGASWNVGTRSSLAGQREFGPALQCNTAVQFNATTDPIQSGVRLEDNYFDGGAPYTVNVAWNNLNIKVIIDTLINNQFGHNSGGWAGDGFGNTSFAANDGSNNTYTVAATTGHGQILSASNNRYQDNQVSINLRVS